MVARNLPIAWRECDHHIWKCIDYKQYPISVCVMDTLKKSYTKRFPCIDEGYFTPKYIIKLLVLNHYMMNVFDTGECTLG